tara:strand:+ start:369 stop:1154 length:786 start_codon:yes stop_codon:yes gene_type:complete
MATIDLGKIKLVWRGTYAGGTAYTVDDVVQHTDSGLTSSFICTTNSTGNAPSTGGSVHGSWAYLAKGSGDATLTTQGDVLYYGGSGLARLAAGTSGQVLQTGGSGANPSWVDVAGGAFAQFQYRTVISNEYTNSNSGSYVEATNHYIDITPTSNSASTKILVNLIPHVLFDRSSTDIGFQYQIHRTVGGTTTDLLTSSSVQFYYNGSNNIRFPSPIWYMDTPQTTSSCRYSFRFKNPHGGSQINVGGGGNVQNHHMAWELN